KPVITWSDPSAIVVGTALGGAQLNAQANVPGVFKYSPTAGIVLGVGRYQLSVSFTPTDAANYTTATKNVTLTVNAPTAQALGYDMTNYIAEVASNTIRWTAFFDRFAEERNIFPPPSPFTDCCLSG
ncbi:MAG TPA: hypothetical protein VEQ40_09775, partial [Pyrinomonadaceae bacterium]|nr:hypothetical protein [Pyrinomonadaceae bacterium]